MSYKVKMISNTETGKAAMKKNEAMLKDLIMVMPTLKKHHLEGEIHTKIRKLRSGRKEKSYTLEVSRKFQGQDLVAKAELKSSKEKIKVLRDLKTEIRNQIQDIRSKNRPPIEDYTFSQGITVKKLAEVYLEGETFLKVMARKIRQDMQKGKKPNTNDNYVGIEIELASKKDREFICEKLFEVGVGKHICIKNDSSIQIDNNYPERHEICILAKQGEYAAVVEKVCHVLNSQCDVRVDKSCGLHVHVDMRNRDYKKAFYNLVSSQQFLYAMLPAARRNSRYSYPIKGTEWRDDADRYHGINAQAYSKYKTIEARMHCGTTQAKKIINWTALLLGIVDAPKFNSMPTKISEFQEFIGAPDGLMDYVRARIAKFESQHSKAKYTAEAPGTVPVIEKVESRVSDDTPTEQSEVA